MRIVTQTLMMLVVTCMKLVIFNFKMKVIRHCILHYKQMSRDRAYNVTLVCLRFILSSYILSSYILMECIFYLFAWHTS